MEGNIEGTHQGGSPEDTTLPRKPRFQGKPPPPPPLPGKPPPPAPPLPREPPPPSLPPDADDKVKKRKPPPPPSPPVPDAESLSKSVGNRNEWDRLSKATAETLMKSITFSKNPKTGIVIILHTQYL